MKKLIYLFIAISIFGCSSDSNNTTTSDPIIGKWRLAKEVFYNGNTVIMEIPADNCEMMSSTEYKSNKTASFIYYSENTNQGTCQLDNSDWEYFKWSNLDNVNYKFTSKITGENEEVEEVALEFKNTNTLIVKDNSSGVINSQSYTSSGEVYTKI